MCETTKRRWFRSKLSLIDGEQLCTDLTSIRNHPINCLKRILVTKQINEPDYLRRGDWLCRRTSKTTGFRTYHEWVQADRFSYVPETSEMGTACSNQDWGDSSSVTYSNLALPTRKDDFTELSREYEWFAYLHELIATFSSSFDE